MGNIVKHLSNSLTKGHRSALYFTVLMVFALYTSGNANAQSSQIQGAANNTQVYSGVVYGPIDQNDTLWRIASRYKQDSRFTVYQTMMAIYELNKQAFENGNFNTMVNGATLQLPSDRYIARMDAQSARAKADRDDRALGRTSAGSNGQAGINASNVPSSENLKPEVPLVNQEDLSKTSSQLQSQLNGLRQQQQQQFNALKNQVAASINSVEVLLEENKKLSNQLLLIDENNRNLTEKVENELQIQIDQQVDQLSQLIALVKDAEQRRIDKEAESVLQILSSPVALIIIMSVVTLLIIGVLMVFLLRKPAAQHSVVETAVPAKDIVDEDLVIGELEGELDQDSEDLLAALSEEEGFEDDDILSDALEDDELLDSLSDDDLDDLDGLGDLDDMLVPDSPNDATSVDVSIESVVDEFDTEDESISLDDDDSPGKVSDVPVSGSNKSDGDDKDATVDEIDFDELDVTVEDEDDSNDLPSGIDLDESGEIDDDVMEQIGSQIQEKDQTINRMADEILDELDNVPSDSTDIDELLNEADIEANNEADESVAEKPGDSALTTDADIIEPDDINEDLTEQISNSVDDNQDEQQSADELDALLDSIGTDDIDELVAAPIDLDTEIPALDETQDKNLLTDEEELDALLDSVGTDDIDELVAAPIDLDTEISAPDETQDNNSLTDEEELDALLDSVGTDDIDELVAASIDLDTEIPVLDETQDKNLLTDKDELDALLDLSDDDGLLDIIDDELSDSEMNVQVSALADELLQELEGDEGELDELDSLLNEFEEPQSDANTDESTDSTVTDIDVSNEANIDEETSVSEIDDGIDSAQTITSDEVAPPSILPDTDDLLDDIPSFTSDMTLEDEDESESESESESAEEVLAVEPVKDITFEEVLAGGQLLDTQSTELEESEPEPDPEAHDNSTSEALQPNTDNEQSDSSIASQEHPTPHDEESIEQDPIDLEDDSDEDVLSGLPGLDNWLDEEEQIDTNVKLDTAESDNNELDLSALDLSDDELSSLNDNVLSEDGLLEGLDDVDFDDMLNDLALDDGDRNDGPDHKDNPLGNAGLDLDMLMDDEIPPDLMTDGPLAEINDDSSHINEKDLSSDNIESFVDVDELLGQSDAMAKMNDEDVKLDLNDSLGRLAPQNDEDVSPAISDVESNQASNLDLAQVYMDMEDHEAAKELLQEVERLGNKEQKDEAVVLLNSIKK